MKQRRIFEPAAINVVAMKNRLVAPPMVTNFGIKRIEWQINLLPTALPEQKVDSD